MINHSNRERVTAYPLNIFSTLTGVEERGALYWTMPMLWQSDMRNLKGRNFIGFVNAPNARGLLVRNEHGFYWCWDGQCSHALDQRKVEAALEAAA